MPVPFKNALRKGRTRQPKIQPWEVLAPNEQTVPLVFASPHSGRTYPLQFVAASNLDWTTLRGSEDAFIDEVFATAPEFGAPLLRAHFPRAYVDVNREPYELDAEMFSDQLPDHVTTKSPRITAGLGTIARVVTNGDEIYEKPLRFAEARRRIEACHLPYHLELRGLIDATLKRFGGCLLIDCHSMPSASGPMNLRPESRVDVVLGDAHGSACARAVSELAEETLIELGFSVIRNKPYAGGYTTRHYGRPEEGVHVLQIEINRALYMDENRIQRGPGLSALVRRMERLIKALTAINPTILVPPPADGLKAAE